MKRPVGRLAQLWRLIHINWVFLKHGLDEPVFALHFFKPLRFLYWAMPWHWWQRDLAPVPVRIREALEELGPIYVKFGQLLSTRQDLLPLEIVVELAKLQDKVPPFGGAIAKRLIEEAYGFPLSDICAEFSLEPLASASIAQVHAARLHDGKEVVIKVIRPDVHAQIAIDLGLLHTVARLADKYWSHGKRLRVRELVQDYERTLFDELNLMHEAANASQIKRNFAANRLLYIPEIHWPYTRPSVMMMERIHGTPIADITALKAHGVNLKRLAERGVEIFFTQVFRDSFFHADMHPGNIFVDVRVPQDPKFIVVDFGIVGSLGFNDQRYLAENFLAFFKRDYRRVAELHIESGWVPKDTSVTAFESAMRTVCEPVFERPLKDISFGHLLLQLFETAQRFHMHIQPQLVLLQKTIWAIEGLGRQLYPDLDLWSTTRPILEDWLKRHQSPKRLWRKTSQQLSQWSEILPEFPGLLYAHLKRQPDNDDVLKSILHELKNKPNDGTYRWVYLSLGAAMGLGLAFLGRFI